MFDIVDRDDQPVCHAESLHSVVELCGQVLSSALFGAPNVAADREHSGQRIAVLLSACRRGSGALQAAFRTTVQCGSAAVRTHSTCHRREMM